MKQILFVDTENGERHSGILTDDGDIICGCCGGLIPADEVGDGEEYPAKILKIYNSWVSLDEEICGDELYMEEED